MTTITIEDNVPMGPAIQGIMAVMNEFASRSEKSRLPWLQRYKKKTVVPSHLGSVTVTTNGAHSKTNLTVNVSLTKD